MIILFLCFMLATENRFALTGIYAEFATRNIFFMKSPSACPGDWQMFNSSCYRGFSSFRILSFSEAEVRYLSEYRISINSGAGAVCEGRQQGGAPLSPQSPAAGVHAGAGQSSGMVWPNEGSLSWSEAGAGGGAGRLNVSLSGGRMLSDKLGLAWSDGSPTDFSLWAEAEVEERRGTQPGCVALFADLVFQHTRQAEHWEIFSGMSRRLQLFS